MRQPDPPCSRVGRGQLVRDLPRQVQVHTVLPTVPNIPAVWKERLGTRRTYP